MLTAMLKMLKARIAQTWLDAYSKTCQILIMLEESNCIKIQRSKSILNFYLLLMRNPKNISCSIKSSFKKHK